MQPWFKRMLWASAALAVGLFLIKLVAGLAARGYRALTQEVDRMVSTIAGGGSSSVEQVVSLGLTLVVVIIAVRFVVRGR